MVPTLRTIMNCSHYYGYRENIHLDVKLNPASHFGSQTDVQHSFTYAVFILSFNILVSRNPEFVSFFCIYYWSSTFSISHLFVHSLNVKQFYLTPTYDTNRCYHSGSKVSWEQWQWSGTPCIPIPLVWSLTIRWFNDIFRTLVGGWSYPSIEIQSSYSTAPADLALGIRLKLYNLRKSDAFNVLTRKETMLKFRNIKIICIFFVWFFFTLIQQRTYVPAQTYAHPEVYLTIIAAGNRIDGPSSNPEWGWLRFILNLSSWESMNQTVLPHLLVNSRANWIQFRLYSA